MPETWLLFLDNEGTTLLRAYASYYPPDDLERFHRALDRPWEESDRPIMVAEARRSFPGSFPWPWAHYWLSAVALLVAGFVVAILVTAIVQAST